MTKNKGYAFLDKPFLIDVLSVAAFEEGKYCSTGVGTERVTEDAGHGALRLRAEVVVHTRRKLNMLLAAAVASRNRVLILSALGCGAFKNPPEDIAALFREVLPRYAHCFDKVIFAITGPNFAVFKRAFERELAVQAARAEGIRWDNLAVLPCKYGGECRLLDDPKHRDAFAHPPRCADFAHCPAARGAAGRIHALTFLHKQHCKDGAKCARNVEAAHREWYTHPDPCPHGAACDSADPKHLAELWHLPLCPDGQGCAKLDDPAHKQRWRHRAMPCPDGATCQHWRDATHQATLVHPFLPPCPELEKCQDETPEHRRQFAHVCTWGDQCKQLGEYLEDPDKAKPDARAHVRQHVHMCHRRCPNWETCTKVTEWHLRGASHKGVKDIRPPCKDGTPHAPVALALPALPMLRRPGTCMGSRVLLLPPGVPSGTGTGHASHSVIPKTVEGGGCSRHALEQKKWKEEVPPRVQPPPPTSRAPSPPPPPPLPLFLCR